MTMRLIPGTVPSPVLKTFPSGIFCTQLTNHGDKPEGQPWNDSLTPI